MVEMLNKGEPLPVDFNGRFIYYVGPVDPVRDEVVGPAGPTTATRMDKFTEQVLAKPACSAWSAKPNADRRRSRRSGSTGRST